MIIRIFCIAWVPHLKFIVNKFLFDQVLAPVLLDAFAKTQSEVLLQDSDEDDLVEHVGHAG